MYTAFGAEPIRIGSRPPNIQLPPAPVDQGGEDGVVPSWARGVIAIALVGGALVFLLRVAEEREKLGWKVGY